MDFSLTEEQQMFQRMVRDFAAKELEPIAGELDEKEEFPTEIVKKMGELGLFGVGISEEYGGGGGGAIEVAIAAEEISRGDAGTACTHLASLSLAGHPIYKTGTHEQKLRYTVPMARGEKLAAFALTEPGAGSDAGAVQTAAVKKGDKYVLNGTKVFISNGGVADIIVVFATMDRELKHKGVVCLVVEKGAAGFSVGKSERKLGIRSSNTAELVFENCAVPEENRIGDEGKGFRIAIEAIDSSRTTVAAQAVGIAQAAFEASVAFAKDRQQFGQAISNFQAIQWMLSDMATNIDAARLLTYRACYLKDKGLPFIKEAAMAKVFAAEAAMAITTKAVQIHGGYGYVKDYPVERYFRDAKITEIYEGTSEMQRLTIARDLLR